MDKTGWGDVAELVLFALRQRPMTRSQICEFIKMDKNRVSGVITRLHRPGKRVDQRIYIHGYINEGAQGERVYPRALYAVGTHADAPRPVSKRQNILAQREARRQQMFSTLGSGSGI